LVSRAQGDKEWQVPHRAILCRPQAHHYWVRGTRTLTDLREALPLLSVQVASTVYSRPVPTPERSARSSTRRASRMVQFNTYVKISS
jgi:hypothetical protein